MVAKRTLKADTTGKKIRGYKFRIYPTREQRQLLERHFGANRFVYNACLEKAITEYKETGKRVNFLELRNQYVRYELSAEHPWLKTEINASMINQAIVKDLNSAFRNFFQRRNQGVGFPRFKSRKNNYQSFGLPAGVRPINGGRHIHLPKKCGGDIRMRMHRPLPPEGEIKTSRIYRTPSDRYYVSMTVYEGALPETVDDPGEDVVGIDVGLTHFAILSTGEKVENPRFLQNSLQRKKVLSQRLSRKQKGSNNRRKARKRLAKLDERIANQRNHIQHEITRSLIDRGETQAYAVETLNVKGMMQNHHLARHIADVSWSSFISKLDYKAAWSGKKVIKIYQWEPTSKTCSVCGYRMGSMPLNIREWACPECGTTHDRDINAARNIRQIAIRDIHSGGNTAGEPVDSSPVGGGMKQEPRVRIEEPQLSGATIPI